MKARSFETLDHPEISRWWKHHGFPVMPLSDLPSNGAVVEGKDGTLICAAWFYSTDTSVAWMEYLVKNPDITMDVTSQALDMVVEDLSQKAKDQGFKILFTCTDKKSLMNRLERLSFIKADEQVTHYVRRL